ncbi:bifunctional peptidase and arginyl-hydroxylase JMJD5-like [Anneissia japonica]|uniref:bifunctional peptidase and arginyl-hydroxylase JMJD5-like n=1 Tax=Anneissia japonica TaxID=1529436 RepID=UPI0014256D00|nr:bifunctional peptidase and arginyl-hydroxylase JMJD5-like [Anneissia japonica]
MDVKSCAMPVFGIFSLLFLMAECQVPFPKDMRMDVKFPPPFRSNSRSGTGVPDGHLRPLGFQRKPEGKVKEVTDVPHPKDFSSLHVTKKKPLVLRGAVKDALAFEKWSDNYLEENFGDLKLLIEVKKENRAKTQRNIISFKDFLRGYKREDWYAVTVLPDEMRPHVKVPQCLLCGSFKKLIQESNFWMSSGGTSSVLHYDADHNIHCLLDGRKDFIFIHPKYSKFLEMADKSPDAGSGYSVIDVEMINMFKYSGFAKVPWTWTTIWPGDCVFIPSGYFHQVRSYGRSMSYAILFTTEPNFNDSDCSDDFPYTSLDQVPVFWTYKKGDKVIHKLISLVLGSGPLPPVNITIVHMFNNCMLSLQAFKIFDKRNRGFINRKQILDADVEMFKDVARLLDEPSYDINKNPIHGSHDEL